MAGKESGQNVKSQRHIGNGSGLGSLLKQRISHKKLRGSKERGLGDHGPGVANEAWEKSVISAPGEGKIRPSAGPPPRFYGNDLTFRLYYRAKGSKRTELQEGKG